jgi:ATP phosphoribosyltransferase
VNPGNTPPPRALRLSLPSKGRLADEAAFFLEECGLRFHKPNPRQYAASIPNLPGLAVLFQRAADIVTSVRDGGVEFGITGLDVVEELRGQNGEVLVLHDALQFGQCELCLAVPESWAGVEQMADLRAYAAQQPAPLRVVTRFPHLTGSFLSRAKVNYSLVSAEGTLEAAPAIGYADLICDLVSSGQTLRDNRLRPLEEGVVLRSQAVLIANTRALRENPQALQIARTLLEYMEAHLRARDNLAVFANIRGNSPEEIAHLLFTRTAVGGLQGPTISRVVVRQGEPNWYAINIIVPRARLNEAIGEIRAIGGSGVVVVPVTYIFEEEPPRYAALLKAIAEG